MDGEYHSRHRNPTKVHRWRGLDALDNNSSLTIQLVGISFVTLFLAVLEPGALVILQHPMLAAEMPLAEGAVADDPLGRLFAVFMRAADFLRGAAAQGEGYVQGGGWWDGERFEG